MIKNLPARQETLVRFLGWEDLLEKGLATHFNILGLPLWLRKVKNLLAMQETRVWVLSPEDPLEKGWATHSSILGLPLWLSWKESACHVGDLGSIPGLGRSPGEGKGYPLQYSGMENSIDCIVHEVTKSQTWLSDFHFTSITHWGSILWYGANLHGNKVI